MKFGSVCSGIESASVAWEPLGFKPQWFSEIEPFPCAVLAERWPHVPNLGDMTRIANAPAIDLLVAGTPCQSFSVAGLRGGLDDDRGNLALVFSRLARDLRPRWVVWENVPGVLSSNGGRDFGSIIGALVELGYGVAYRVLDAQFFGVPQRRRRVFVVGCLGDWRGAAAVLFERESLLRSPAPRRAQGEEVAGTLGGGSGSRGRAPDTDRMTFIPDMAKTLTTSAQRLDSETETLLACRSEEVNRLYRIHASCGGPEYVGTLSSKCPTCGELCGDWTNEVEQPIPFDSTQITSRTNRSNPQSGAPSHTLAKGAHPPAIAFHHTQDPIHGSVSPCLTKDTDGMGVCVTGSVTHTLRAEGFDASEPAKGRGQSITVAWQEAQTGCREYELAGTLRANGPGHDPVGTRLRTGTQVRRLTPRECERLQGFPDDHTLITYRGKPASDGPRYHAIGNSKAVPVVRWLGRRIQFVDRVLRGVA